MNYADHYSTRTTPQTEPIPGSAQAENNAGGYSFVVDDWGRLDRFLVLGSDGGTYYVGERELTRANAQCVERCIKADGPRTVARIVELSDAGRAPKNDPALFALAMCSKLGDQKTREAANKALPKVARIGTHLFHYVKFVEAFGGWGAGTKRAVQRWYTGRDEKDLAFQVAKYQQRDGWSHRDVLRLAKPKGATGARQEILRWAVGKAEEPVPLGWPLEADGGPLQVLVGMAKAKHAQSVGEVAKIVADYRLPFECVPSEHLAKAEVWHALLPAMGLTALTRNLGRMTANGALAPLTSTVTDVASRLLNGEAIKRARVHPLAFLIALKTYASGHGVKGNLSWQPIPQIVDALDAAFYLAFEAVVPTGKRTMMALDVSGSMDGGSVAGSPLTPREGSAAMAMVMAKTEPHHMFVAFATQLVGLDLSKAKRLDDVCKGLRAIPMGGTDCSLPMVKAREAKIPVDVFQVYTDSETWAGAIHPAQALKKYREKMSIPAKLVVVGMTATQFTIADPNDAGMLDIIGFDTAAPALMADFARG